VLVEHPVDDAAVADSVGPGLRQHVALGGFGVKRDAAGNRVVSDER
jgi:hypothetical protein